MLSNSKDDEPLFAFFSIHLTVKSIATDCDKDVLLIKVSQEGAACHDGYYSCFYRQYQQGKDWTIIGDRKFDPEKVYKK